MAHQFTTEEFTDIHFCYGLANESSTEARRLYEEKFHEENQTCSEPSDIYRCP